MSNLTVTTLAGKETNNNTVSIAAGHMLSTPKLYSPGSVVQVQHVRTSDGIDLSVQDLSAISALSINFTPKFSTSKILLTAMINSNATYVSSFGFLRNGTSLSSTSPNSNAGNTLSTSYYGDNVTTNMRPTYIEWLDDAGSTSSRVYAAGAVSSWAGTLYTIRINDRSDNVMRSYSSMTIMEIAQ